MRRMLGGLAALWLVLGPSAAWANNPASDTLCTALARSVQDTAPGNGPVFVASYRKGPSETQVPEALRSTAFTYDNALAIVALLACGDADAARRIGDAFLIALDADRTFHDGRLRNAYRAGPVKEQPVLLPGWWDRAAKHWAEDRYQDGSATGNVAWAGLALLALHDESGDPRYLAGARKAADWIRNVAYDQHAPGFTGGVDGFDPEQEPLRWKSTEHNTDVLALANWLGRKGDDSGRYAAMARSARAFLDVAFDPESGCFRMGTTPKGAMRDLDAIALDTQLWPPVALADPPAAWKRAPACAERRLKVGNGFDFNDDRDGLWVEGTAQAALTTRLLGNSTESARLLDAAAAQAAPSGWLYATAQDRLTTGLRIGPSSTSDDFFYFRRPHLGATAWAVLAVKERNPFLPTQAAR